MAIITAAAAKAQEASLADATDAAVDSAIAEFEELVETYCNRRYVSASKTFEVSERPLPATVLLPDINVSSVTATADGVSVDMGDVIVIETSGVIHRMPWAGTSPAAAVMSYTTVDATIPLAIKRAAAIFAAKVIGAAASGTSGDVRWQSADGAYAMETADWSAGRPTAWREVNRVLNQYRLPIGFG